MPNQPGTGPVYPPEPTNFEGIAPIGGFITGVSAIGDVVAFNRWQTVLSQYANSPIITQMIKDFQDASDQTVNFDSFFDLMWNVYTAKGYGLDCWGTIVGVNRVLHLGVGPKYLGFNEGGFLDYDPFNQSPWYSGQKLTNNFLLTDDGFRVLILAKAFSNICNGSIQAINQLLMMLFGTFGKCYVVDNEDMTMVYKFEFALSPVQLAILTQSGVMPTPTGVGFTVSQP